MDKLFDLIDNQTNIDKIKNLKHITLNDLCLCLEKCFNTDNDIDKKKIKKFLNIIYKKLPDPKFIKKLTNKNNINSIFDESKNVELISEFENNLLTKGQESLFFGVKSIDDYITFAKGQFIIIQAMSNHGKTTFKLNLMHRFLTEKANLNKNVSCHFFSWESNHIMLNMKLINIFSKQKIVKHCPSLVPLPHQKKLGNYIIENNVEYQKNFEKITELKKNKKLCIYKNTYMLDEIEQLIEVNNKEFPEKTHVYFLDYIQIIDHNLKAAEGNWLKLQLLSSKLAKLCVKFNAIIITSSQVSDDGELAESKGMYRPADLILDIFNNSHLKIKDHKSKVLQSKYEEAENGKNMYLTIKTVKHRYGQNIELKKKFKLIEGDYISEHNNIQKLEDLNFSDNHLPPHMRKKKRNNEDAMPPFGFVKKERRNDDGVRC
jgi:hypothetical protein